MLRVVLAQGFALVTEAGGRLRALPKLNRYRVLDAINCQSDLVIVRVLIVVKDPVGAIEMHKASEKGKEL